MRGLGWLLAVGGLLHGTALAKAKPAPPQPVLELQVQIAQPRGVVGKPPELKLSLRNPKDQPQNFLDSSDPACFVFRYLQITLRGPDGRAQEARAPCQTDDWPGELVPIRAGATLHRTIPLRPFFPGEFPAGHYVVQVALAGSTGPRPTLGTHRPQPSPAGLREVEFDLQQPLQTFVIKKGQTQRLSDGAQLRFDGHSHKDVMPGQESPLLIHGRFAAPGSASLQDFSLNVYPTPSTLLRLAERYLFVLDDYAYGEHMRLHYLGPEPASPSP